ncbi:MAG: thiamine phosphate synthase [Rhodospirillaceae bacterium]|nr:thiamine phosphate synthase [Rhodospirillaceae bacterium]
MVNSTNQESIRCRLYILTPPLIPDLNAFARTLEDTLAAGDVACVQLRLKDVDDATIRQAAKALMPVCHAKDVAFILNDRPDLAKELGCDGVHVGPEDASYDEARSIVGPNAMVGVTCRNSRHLAMELAEAGADYVAFGPFFASDTKDVSDREPAELETLSIWSETINVPCVAIGGITVENCEPLVAAGADFLAVTSGVWNYKDGPAAAVKAFNAIFDKTVG